MPKRILALLLVVAASALAACQPTPSRGAVLDPPKLLDDFTLDAADGGTFRLSDYAGEIVLVYFGYTFCPDVCPTTMLELKNAVEALGDDAAEVNVVMISVDPERDSPESLNRYVTNFNPAFRGARTDDPAALDEVLAQFGAFYEAEDAEGASEYLVSHTASVFLVNRDSELAELFTYGTPAEDIAADVKAWLRQ